MLLEIYRVRNTEISKDMIIINISVLVRFACVKKFDFSGKNCTNAFNIINSSQYMKIINIV